MIGSYSFLLAGFVLWVTVSLWLMRVQTIPPWLRIVSALASGAALIGLWLLVRPTTTPGLSDATDAEKLIGAGKPTLLEFYSEY